MNRIALAALLALVPNVSNAHPAMGDANGILLGFLHPFSGIDHVLAMTAVGLFAAHLGGRALWVVPLSFLSAMVLGGVLGMGRTDLLLVEMGIGFSVIVFGLAVAFQLRLPTLAATLLVGFFAIFHGQAHGMEMPANVPGIVYAAGFISATALLHVSGIQIGLSLASVMESNRRRILQLVGWSMTFAGANMVAGII